MPGYFGAVLHSFDNGRRLKTDSFRYKHFPVNKGSIQFKVKADHDAYIALTSDIREAGPMYELILGGSGNTKSAIRKNRLLPYKARVDSPGIVNKNYFTNFWLRWGNGFIYAGRNDEPLPFISWYDPEPFEVFFCGVCTGYGGTGVFNIQDIETTEDYTFFPVANSIAHSIFRASKDVRIALTTEPKVSDSMYEITFGVAQEADSKITKHNIKASLVKQVSFGKLQNCNINENYRYVGTKITWQGGKICAGLEDDDPIMTWTDEELYQINYVGLATDSGQFALWKLVGPPGHPHTLPTVGASGTWIDASDGQIPPGAIQAGQQTKGEPTYIARVVIEKNKYPGELFPSRGGVYFRNMYIRQYQVLVRTPSSDWVATSGNNIPPRAYPVGKDEKGEVLYVGRVRQENLLIIGRVQKSTGKCHILNKGKETAYKCYEILTF